MKDKIFTFFIGLLLGAVITSSGFLVYEKVNKQDNQMPNEGAMQMMERPNGNMPEGEVPPEKPEGMENDSTRPEPPERKNQSTQNNENNKENN